ncbi:hypothetical protein K2Z83_11375 [Oscillochloris sp. ZM17-4]|uniref:nSTAND1 domain-containing NTPase n=1 Tax=Oscillochloris sp. ZM17-4 TaxID=2866714 RepID=UPI001C73C54F|nr:WD40 repeat domain-containing protein [Oscillochloris sp. ZM17-4]MBX0328276.1 hypothetical protein [Oscillochloris sp. ZM17-4]
MTTPLPSQPFLGPRPFQTGETLYGRDYEARSLLSMLVAERIVLLHSPSGAGKTSLIQAALIPLLEERAFTVLPTVRVGEEPPAGWPGNRYARAMLRSLEEGAPAEQRLPPAEIEPLGLAGYLARRAPAEADQDTVLIIDQFEEVLTRDPTDTAAKLAFFRELGAALQLPRLWALVVIREEYVAALEPFARRIPSRLASHFRLDLLGVEGALEALREPPRAAGVDFPAALAARLVDDLRRVNVQQADGAILPQLGPSVEPVQLQVVGLRLWERLTPGATQIAPAHLEALGDVSGALGDYYAERVAATAQASGVSERALRAWFDRELITPQGVRGQVLQGAGASAGLPNQAIARLIDAYLVRAEPRRGATWFELAHDRLIAPVRAGNAAWFAANLSTLQRQAELWQQQGRPEGLLLRGASLAEAEQWAAANAEVLTPNEQDFLDICRAARRRAALLRGLSVAVAVAGLIALILALVANSFRMRAEANARQSRARELAAASVSSLSVDPQRGLLLARAAADTTRAAGEPVVAEAVQALQQAAQVSRVRQIVPVGERGLQDLAASPDGQTLATTGNDGAVRIFDAEGAQRLEIPAGAPAINQPALGLALSPDGARVAAGVGPLAIIWDAASGAEVVALEGHSDTVVGLAYSPDGATLASAGYDGLVILWDAATGAERRRMDLGAVEVNALAFSPQGDKLVSGDSDGRTIIWSMPDGERLQTLRGHTGEVLDVAYDPLGEFIASVSDDLSARLWDVRTGAALDVLRGHTGTVEAVAFSPDGRLLATASQDNTARVWAVGDGHPVLTLAGHANGLRGALFSPDGSELLTASLDGTLRRWDLAMAPPGGAYLVAFSPDGATLASAGADGASLWDAADGRQLREIRTDAEISALAWSPDGATLALGDVDGFLMLYDPSKGEKIADLDGHGQQINRLAFSLDGATLASVSDDGTARLWDVASGAERLSFAGHAAEVSALAWAPDGKTLATADFLGAIIVWDAADGAERARATLYANEVINGLAFSPDGATLAAGDEGGLLALYDPTTGAETRRISAGGPLDDLAYSPDGGTLASSGRDKTARLWAAADLTPLAVIPHPAEVYSLAYRPDGAALATAAADGQARLLPLKLDDLLDLAARRTLRPPTPEECAEYGLKC